MEFLPRANSRRGTAASNVERPDIAAMTAQLELGHGMIARDFEQAIAEDADGDDHSIRSEHETPRWRAASHNPTPGRKSTLRRAIQNSMPEKANRSRDSSRSRSTSPPNSVDAFAGPQRRRRGTIESQAPSYLSLQRTVSNGQRSRRPTFSDNKSNHTVESPRSSVAEDVCFPPERDANKTYTIDYEELEEFVAESHEKTPVAHPFAPLFGNQKQPTQKVFTDLRRKSVATIDTAGKEKHKAKSDMFDEKIDGDDKLGQDMSSSDGDVVDKIQTNYFENQNRFTMFSSEAENTIHAPELGGLLMPGESFRDLFELGPDGGVYWLDMLNPSEEEVFAICKAFGVHPLTREDITTQETREKVELFKSYYFVCFRSFYQEDNKSEDFMEPINVYAVVFREGLLTFSFCVNPHAANVRKRIGRLRDYVNLSADWICYALM